MQGDLFASVEEGKHISMYLKKVFFIIQVLIYLLILKMIKNSFCKIRVIH